MTSSPRPAVFLDRDGTINQEVGYIRELEKLVLIPGAAEAIRGLNQMGIPVVLVTNQSGVARGYYPEDWLGKLHQRLAELLAVEGAHLDGVYYCPHLPEGNVAEYSYACDCRKPEPGMLEQAARDLNLDLAHSFMVGDKATDIDVGVRVGAQTVLLRSGYGEQVLRGEYQHRPDPDYVFSSLNEAYQTVMKAFFEKLLN
ncbi:D-glycero-beta-D-manno-heptose-1,7-bisphosphate 7-phosphatase [bacterium (Candidatus Blackallbacteria) CG17_big_fil_post_rev_8_21_14_2_50_48_46]|uniref:D,D-heptose 1,7-bisphosphate phosphatase n=1 Tax=bacterium (Candidatus Blackallbacteria) CG17_big_fil_post_rev_8_21_14_2_50_48_46 TaxID=2014261 RepID=A0A2M7G1M7_9BACT|nr:MAG: D-glycero-beta-D-manno-heptose-1,7-bisphosphate 7-phosphatase [bacterium (Candidatus Blackallbacteria) CG18_big_fil_WC_8_21_14_2_50_49_26]PIW15637.1 MAG: D-glycero-beta-D-manno-heptose-1,7-bisphosphate 7-phosphatase [bacterium (Candidatus Blackallbacteria) CG17_big_fil_post_rev_8_21_14_2_50_48_46]PIW48121.1 MAG: D-glycero-beta-D-manno-heptose-1,7-bisphosphate 7-phosphatase [bacterium (Candidatus Blackallbacteria) CG13_big_fil_rev_8_21_14_2_50_49_14]